ncbi:MAG: glycosyltransferase, partial [Candidatus Eisenbacteria bacterium]
MRILQVNKFFFLKGGAERYFFALSELLDSRGHEIVSFSMKDPRNLPSRYSENFVSHVTLDGSGPIAGRLRTAGRIIYSFEARRKLRELISRTRPDVAHLHNIAHQISPSIIGLLKSSGVPVVQTLQDYKLACPAYLMMVRGKACDKCVPGRFYNVIANRCVQESVQASLVSCAEAYLHRLLHTFAGVDAFLCSSRFMMQV